MKSNYKLLGEFIRQVDVRNVDMITDRVLGINIDKYFMPSVANVIGTDLSKYKLLQKGLFACNPMHVGRDERLPVALYNENTPAVVSPAYFMFQIGEKTLLNEDFLMMWFRCPEFDRQCWLKTDGSVRGGITWDDLCRLEIPIIPYQEQLNIVRQYKTIADRIALKQKINDILEAQMQMLFKSWFVDFDPFCEYLITLPSGKHIPRGWKESTLGEYVIYSQGTQVAVEEQFETGSDNRIRFLRIVDYTGNTNDPPRYIDNKPTISVCEPDDILIIRYGASAGQICRGLKGVFANNLFSVTPKKTIGKNYLYYLLTQNNIHDYITSVGETSSAMPALTHGLINSIPVVIPNDSSFLDKFENIAIKIFNAQQLIKHEIEVLKALCSNISLRMLCY